VEFLNVLVMNVAFLLLFAAYNTIQNYVTSLLPGTTTTALLLVCCVSAPACERVSKSDPREAWWGDDVHAIIRQPGQCVAGRALRDCGRRQPSYASREKWTMVFGALCYVVRTLRQSAIRTRDDGAITVVVMR
jgi:hypothetical protein